MTFWTKQTFKDLISISCFRTIPEEDLIDLEDELDLDPYEVANSCDNCCEKKVKIYSKNNKISGLSLSLTYTLETFLLLINLNGIWLMKTTLLRNLPKNFALI